MPSITPESLLNFFVVLKPTTGDDLVVRHLAVDSAVQRELSAKFIEMAAWWSSDERQKKPYAPTFEPNANQVTVLRKFTIPKIYRDVASSPQVADSFTFPIPKGLSLRAVVGIESRQPAEDSRFFFQVCDQRHVLGYKFVLFQDRNVFRRLDSSGLTITDSLAAVIDNQELLFASFFQAKKFLPLDHLYREASDKEVKELFRHAKLKLPEGFQSDDLLAHLNTPARKKVSAVLDSKILDIEEVTPEKIKSYAKKYRGLDVSLRGKPGSRCVELPSERHDLLEFIRCLDEEFYTSELTMRRCETNSYRPLEAVELKGGDPE
jgi:hypothetical protein